MSKMEEAKQTNKGKVYKLSDAVKGNQKKSQLTETPQKEEVTQQPEPKPQDDRILRARRKEQTKVLKEEVEFLELQVKHYYLIQQIEEINKSIAAKQHALREDATDIMAKGQKLKEDEHLKKGELDVENQSNNNQE